MHSLFGVERDPSVLGSKMASASLLRMSLILCRFLRCRSSSSLCVAEFYAVVFVCVCEKMRLLCISYLEITQSALDTFHA